MTAQAEQGNYEEAAAVRGCRNEAAFDVIVSLFICVAPCSRSKSILRLPSKNASASMRTRWQAPSTVILVIARCVSHFLCVFRTAALL